MKKLVSIALLGLTALILCSWAYYVYVGFDKSISSSGSDWANFGSYIGGVASPVLSFLSIILLVYTIHQQSEANSHTNDETIKLDMLRYISKCEQEIDSWLKTELASSISDKEVQFGHIVWGLVEPSYVNQKELRGCLERLLKLTCSYCSSITLYEANVDPYFIYKQHYSKAIELINFLEKHVALLDQMAGPSLALSKNMLNNANNSTD